MDTKNKTPITFKAIGVFMSFYIISDLRDHLHRAHGHGSIHLH